MINYIKKSWFWIIILIVIAIAGYFFLINDSEKKDQNNIAVLVNNTSFTYDEVDEATHQTVRLLKRHTNPTAEQIEEQLVNMLIERALLTEQAQEKNIEVTSENIDAYFKDLQMLYVLESKEQLLEELKADGFKNQEEIEEALRLEITMEKLAQAYREEIEITEEQIQDNYDVYSQRMEEIGEVVHPLEDVKENIKEDLLYNQSISLLFDKIENMKEGVEVQLFLEEDYFKQFEEPEIIE